MSALGEVFAALDHAKAKHPRPWRNRFHALCVLLEEVAEVVWAIIRRDRVNLREELAQVAAVCMRWLKWESVRQDAPGSTQECSGVSSVAEGDRTRQEGSRGQKNMSPEWCKVCLNGVEDEILGMLCFRSKAPAGRRGDCTLWSPWDPMDYNCQSTAPKTENAVGKESTWCQCELCKRLWEGRKA